MRLFSVLFIPTQSNVDDNPRHTISATVVENTDTAFPSSQRFQSSPAPQVLALTNISVQKYVNQSQLPLNNPMNLFCSMLLILKIVLFAVESPNIAWRKMSSTGRILELASSLLILSKMDTYFLFRDDLIL